MRRHPRKGYASAIGALYGEGSTLVTPVDRKPRKRAVLRSNGIRRTEAQEQAMLVRWLRTLGLLVHSIPNHGKRSVWAGERERAMGLLRGVSDLFLAEPRGKWHGFYIEMKSRGNKPRPEQIEFMQLVRAKGYVAKWYDSFEAAQVDITAYLGVTDGTL